MPSDPTLTPEQQRIGDAIAQLNRSERGRRAAVQLRRFLDANDGSALSLDQNNWEALESLIRACRVFGGHAIRDLLPRR